MTKSKIVNGLYVLSVLLLLLSLYLRTSGKPSELYWAGLLVYAFAEMYKRSDNE